MPEVHAIDLSHWNTVESFEKVKRSGVVGVIHKATEGSGYVDPTYADRMIEALDAGLLWGAYHFMRPGDMTQQMEWFVKNAALPVGSRLALDHEDPLVSLDDLCEAVNALKKIGYYEISIYSGHVIKDQLGPKFNATLADTSLWLAHYTTGQPSWPSGTWKTWSLWQYTDQGRQEGISGDCDLNQFNGTAAQCAAWFGPPEAVEVDEPAKVILNIVIQGDADIAIMLNGEAWGPIKP